MVPYNLKTVYKFLNIIIHLGEALTNIVCAIDRYLYIQTQNSSVYQIRQFLYDVFSEGPNSDRLSERLANLIMISKSIETMVKYRSKVCVSYGICKLNETRNAHYILCL